MDGIIVFWKTCHQGWKRCHQVEVLGCHYGWSFGSGYLVFSFSWQLDAGKRPRDKPPARQEPSIMESLERPERLITPPTQGLTGWCQLEVQSKRELHFDLQARTNLQGPARHDGQRDRGHLLKNLIGGPKGLWFFAAEWVVGVCWPCWNRNDNGQTTSINHQPQRETQSPLR